MPKKMTVRVSQDIHERLKQYAASLGVTMKELAYRYLKEAMDAAEHKSPALKSAVARAPKS